MEKINSKTKIFSLLTFFLGITLIFESCKEEKSSKNDIQWINLFDGKTTNGWRVYNGDEIPKKWTVVDGNLTFSTELKLEDEFEELLILSLDQFFHPLFLSSRHRSNRL